MTIFAVLLPSPQPKLVEEIKKSYAENSLQITDTQWIVSDTGTAVDVCRKLKIYPEQPPSGSAIVFSTSSYFGRAPSTIWDWIKVKLEAAPNA